MIGYILSAIFIFVIYFVFFYKPRLKVHTFTRSDKRVVFIEMVHIGTKDYYDEVRSILLRESWRYRATYLYEKVRGTKEENQEAFAYMASIPLTPMYEQLAILLNKQVQPQKSFIEAVPHSINADLEATTMIEAFKKQGLSKYVVKDDMVEKMKTAPPVARFVLRLFFKFILKLSAMFKLHLWYKRNKLKDEVSVKMRDEFLYRTAMETPGNIVITYGAGHYPGFKRLMGKGWKVKSYKTVPV